MKLRTYAEVKNAIPRDIRQGDVAVQMGYDAGAFSHGLTFDPKGQPSTEFIARFEDALTALTSGVMTA